MTSVQGHADPEHPQIHFYGLSFLEPSDTDLLTQMLLADSTEVDALD